MGDGASFEAKLDLMGEFDVCACCWKGEESCYSKNRKVVVCGCYTKENLPQLTTGGGTYKKSGPESKTIQIPLFWGVRFKGGVWWLEGSPTERS